MTALRQQYIAELEEYLRSGLFAEDFLNSPEDRRIEMLNFLEAVMDLGDLADETATAIIFRKRP